MHVKILFKCIRRRAWAAETRPPHVRMVETEANSSHVRHDNPLAAPETAATSTWV